MMSKIDRREIAVTIARELQDTITAPRVSDHPGVTTVESLLGKIEITNDGVVVTTKRGVSAGWTHKESCSPEHSAMRCNLLLWSVS